MIDINEGNSYSNFPINERKRYVEIFNKYKVSAYHCGHTHKFNIIKSQYCCKQIVVGAVGIPLGVDASSGYYIDDKWIKISEPNPDCSKLYIWFQSLLLCVKIRELINRNYRENTHSQGD